jgi:hypothetical protein
VQILVENRPGFFEYAVEFFYHFHVASLL